jgi:esterase/lipase
VIVILGVLDIVPHAVDVLETVLEAEIVDVPSPVFEKSIELKEKSIEFTKELENKNIEFTKELQQKEQELEQTKIKSEIEKKLLREKTLLQQFPKNVQCIYYGIIDNKSISGENLIKFGNSNNLQERVDTHKKTYNNFILCNVFKVSNKIQIENAVKNHLILKKKRRGIMINNKNYTELLAINDYTFDYKN